MDVAVLLVNPKFPHNVGNALRACALLEAQVLAWTGDRVADPRRWPEGARLPREERMKCYARTELRWLESADLGFARGAAPVCVEITAGAEDLRDFVHPERALYVFGPEDGGVPKGIRNHCHRFVRIPLPDASERTPFNLAAAVNIVLWDRFLKQTRDVVPHVSEPKDVAPNAIG
jgi:tRNA(Leu) C34 or U34 (ribose-2'-O)-methylase TrmL